MHGSAASADAFRACHTAPVLPWRHPGASPSPFASAHAMSGTSMPPSTRATQAGTCIDTTLDKSLLSTSSPSASLGKTPAPASTLVIQRRRRRVVRRHTFEPTRSVPTRGTSTCAPPAAVTRCSTARGAAPREQAQLPSPTWRGKRLTRSETNASFGCTVWSVPAQALPTRRGASPCDDRLERAARLSRRKVGQVVVSRSDIHKPFASHLCHCAYVVL